MEIEINDDKYVLLLIYLKKGIDHENEYLYPCQDGEEYEPTYRARNKAAQKLLEELRG